MTASERGFLLLCGDLGDGVTPLSLHQLELLRRRMTALSIPIDTEAELCAADLQRLGYTPEMSLRISALLSRDKVLDDYLALGAEQACYPLSCVSDGFPQPLRLRLGRRCPAVLFYRGNLSLLHGKRIAVVGARDLEAHGAAAAKHLGALAAQEGYTIVSGNARGADKTAQDACLQHGGSVISVVSEPLCAQPLSSDQVLYLAESGWHETFSAARALSRNRLIHALGGKSFVVQCARSGGTWRGSEDALKHGFAEVYAEDDGSEGATALSNLGATMLRCTALTSLASVFPAQVGFFDAP